MIVNFPKTNHLNWTLIIFSLQTLRQNQWNARNNQLQVTLQIPVDPADNAGDGN